MSTTTPAVATARRFWSGDGWIWFYFLLLCAISLIEVYSSTSSLTYSSGRYWEPIRGHAMYLFGGMLVTFVIHKIQCKWFRLYAFLMLPVSVVFLILTPFIGENINGANRIISIFGIHFQPSELAKGAVVAAVAIILAVMQTVKGADRGAMRWILWVTLPICIIIGVDNLSTAALLFATVFIMMIIGRVPWTQLGKLVGVLAVIGSVALAMLMVTPDSLLGKVPGVGKRGVTWKHRIESFADHSKKKAVTAAEFNIKENTQATQAQIAIARSKGIGLFAGNSVQRDFLSQAYSDFIFAIILEEFGLWGGFFVVLIYIMIFFRIGHIAKQCANSYPAFLVMGLGLLIVLQAMMNMCVAVGLMPVTGQPLPLISRGGTSTFINCLYIGMILSVSYSAKKREDVAAPVAVAPAADADAPVVAADAPVTEEADAKTE